MLEQKWMKSFRVPHAKAFLAGERASISPAFSWDKTKEGHGYWYRVYNGRVTPSAYLKVIKMMKEYQEVKEFHDTEVDG